MAKPNDPERGQSPKPSQNSPEAAPEAQKPQPKQLPPDQKPEDPLLREFEALEAVYGSTQGSIDDEGGPATAYPTMALEPEEPPAMDLPNVPELYSGEDPPLEDPGFSLDQHELGGLDLGDIANPPLEGPGFSLDQHETGGLDSGKVESPQLDGHEFSLDQHDFAEPALTDIESPELEDLQLSAAGDAAAEPGQAPLPRLLAEIEHNLPAGDSAGFAQPQDVAAATEKFLAFSLGGTQYGIPLRNVTEVGGIPRITPIPGTPPWLRGITNVRGDIFSVVDLRLFFQLEASRHEESGQAVTLLGHNGAIATLVIVDSVVGIFNIPSGSINHSSLPLPGLLGTHIPSIADLGGTSLAIFDVEQFLDSPQFRQFE